MISIAARKGTTALSCPLCKKEAQTLFVAAAAARDRAAEDASEHLSPCADPISPARIKTYDAREYSDTTEESVTAFLERVQLSGSDS